MEFYNFVFDSKKPILKLIGPISTSNKTQINKVASDHFSAILIEYETKEQYEGDGLRLTYFNVLSLIYKYFSYNYIYS